MKVLSNLKKSDCKERDELDEKERDRKFSLGGHIFLPFSVVLESLHSLCVAVISTADIKSTRFKIRGLF